MGRILGLLGLLILLVFQSYGQADFTVTDNCYGSLTNLAVNTTIPDSTITAREWDLDDDGNFDNATGVSIDQLFATQDTFRIGLRITHTGGVDSTYKNVVIHATPVVNFSVNNLCYGGTAVFTDASTLNADSIVEWKWDFDNDGTPDDILSGPVAQWIAPPPQTNVTRLDVVTDMGCSAFATKSAEVYTQPSARFDFSNTELGDQTWFRNKSTPSAEITLYVWDFGDGIQSLETGDPVHKYDVAGSYVAQLVVMNANFCVDTFQRTVTITATDEGTGKVGIKSKVLTPNSDGFNDVMEIKGFTAFENCELKIYNMWNDLVYENSAYTNDWNGTGDGGEELDPGTYFYVITCDGGEPSIGTINILR
jgi:gliding motility-associated-like protein